MKPILKLFILLLLVQTSVTHAQPFPPFVGFYSSSFSNGSGPVYSVANGNVIRSNGNAPIAGALTISASFSNQQYGTLPGGLTGNDDLGLMFGVSNANGVKSPTSANVGVALSNVGSPTPNYYSPTIAQIGSGMSINGVNASYAFNMFTSAEGLSGQPTDGRFYFGQVTFTFSRPVRDPIMHVTGLGGFLSFLRGPGDNPTLPFATELELVSPFAISRLSGTSHTDLNTTTKTIFNNFQESEYILQGRTPESGDNACTGSFLIAGINVTTLTFNVYLKGMSAGQAWTSVPGPGTQVYNGDRYNISFTLPDNATGALPITGVTLGASLRGSDVHLNWQTVSEINSKEFQLERSTDGVNFKTVGTIAAAGNSSRLLDYSFIDAGMSVKAYYYRLRMVDLDGKFSYSNIAVIRRGGQAGIIKVFPNPVVTATNLEFNNAKGTYAISLINTAGQEVQSMRVFITNDVQYVPVNRNNLIGGTYFLRITNLTTGDVTVEKLIVQ